jgi:hypothetical protein
MGLIGSMWYNIGAKTADLEKGLANSKSKLGQLSSGFEKVTGVSLKSATAFGLAGKAIQETIKYVKDAVDQTVAYNYAMIETSKIVGMTVEEYSRFSQVADDVFISQEKLNTMMMAAARQGKDVSIPGIMALSEQYNALATDQEKAEFTAKNFGRTGLEVNKILDLGPDLIKKKMAAISADLVVTQKAANNTKLFKQSLDALNDSMQGIKYTVGNDVIPIISDFSLILADIVERTKETGIGLDDLLFAFNLTSGGGMIPFTKAIEIGMGIMKDYADELRKADGQLKNFVKHAGDELPSAVQMTAEELAKLEDKVARSYMSIGESVSSAEKDYLSNAQDNNDEWLALLEERATAVKNGYSAQGSYIKEIDAKLDVNAQKAEENAAAHEMATRRIILSYTEQLLAANGLTEEEALYLLQKGEDWGIYADGVVEEAKRVMDEAANIAGAINAIPTVHTIQINTLYTSSGNPNGHPQMGGGGGGGGGGGVVTDETHASGGSFTIPMSYGNEGFRLGNGDTASGGEHIQITPKGQSAGITASELNTALQRQAQFIATAMATALAQRMPA